MADQRSLKLNSLLRDADNARIESACFDMLLKEEAEATPHRVKDLEMTASAEAEAEELLQARIFLFLISFDIFFM